MTPPPPPPLLMISKEVRGNDLGQGVKNALILHLTHTFATWCKTCKTNMHTHFQCKKNYRFGKGEKNKHGYVHPLIVNDMYDSMNATFGQHLSLAFINWSIKWNYEHSSNN